MSDVNGAHPVLSTDRIRGDEHNVENRSPKNKTNRIPSQDRHLNQRLSDMTKYLASMVEGRSRNTLSVRRLVIQYTIDTHGVAFYTETTELVVVSTKKNR